MMIDKQYLIDQYKILHRNNSNYGCSGEYHTEMIREILIRNNIKTILDYGAGKSKLVFMMEGIIGYRYDPSMSDYNYLPQWIFNEGAIDAVITTDVLEHIPDHLLDGVLKEITSISKNQLHFIYLVLDAHFLPDGSPCHVTIKPVDWWINRLSEYLPVIYSIKIPVRSDGISYKGIKVCLGSIK
jgi:hypothetical protein